MISEEKYCRKLISMVFDRRNSSETYNNLFMDLYSRDFTWLSSVPGDANRALDVLELRRSLGFSDILQDKPCSILEMMIALSMRIEDEFMHNEDEGDRTAQWFWEMLVNMDLGSQSDRNYDPAYVNSCIERFIRREYDADGGNGGIFVLDHPRRDLRFTEIWYQAMWYLTEISSY